MQGSWSGPEVWEPGKTCFGSQMAEICAYWRVGTQAVQRALLQGWRAQCLRIKLGRVSAGAQVARKPPSTGRVEPVVMLLRLLSRKRMVSTTFSTSAGRYRSRAG